MEKNLELFMNPCILDLVAHELRQEISETRKKTEGNCPLNAEITHKKDTEISKAIKAI